VVGGNFFLSSARKRK